MAEFTTEPGAASQGARNVGIVNIAAAAVSVALIAGVGVWGYRLLVRDVTGVPVVRAMEGTMRVAPDNPGGEIANHLGLSVNAVPAEGGAAQPQDRLVLAPSNVHLQAEDMDVVPTAEAEEVQPQASADRLGTVIAANVTETEAEVAVTTAVDPNVPLTAEDVLALADQIAAGVEPLSDLADGNDAPVAVAVNGVAVNPDVIPDSVPGLRVSLRPVSRPARLPVATAARVTPAPTAAATTPAATGTVTGAVTTAAIPVGTKLVQLGAFDSPDIAATEWVRLTARFPGFFAQKDQIIQEASSGGRTFYRLRAMGFVDLSDARRFCAALSAEGAACIPVVVR